MIGEMREPQYLRPQEVEIDDFSFLTRCRKLEVLDLQRYEFYRSGACFDLPELKRYICRPAVR